LGLSGDPGGCGIFGQQYHSDLAQRLPDEAALVPRRTAIVQRLHEREQQQKDESE